MSLAAGKIGERRTVSATTSAANGPISQFVIVRVGTGLYGLDVSRVSEVISAHRLEAASREADGVIGTARLAGAVLPVVDLSARLPAVRPACCDDARILITEVRGSFIGLRVDAVVEVLRVRVDRIDAATSADTSIEPRFISGVIRQNDAVITLLNTEALAPTGAP